MAVTTTGAALDLANTLVTTAAPAITQEEKESLLNAYKARIVQVQSASDGVANAPADRAAQLAYAGLVRQLLNAAGFTAPGLSGVTVSVPLDDLDQLLSACCLLILVQEQQADPTGK